jgi:ribosome-binding protein aMBF1 (putative translation factor)
MGDPQFINTESGEILVVLAERDYDALLASAGDEAAEDRMTARLGAEARAAIDNGTDIALPMAVWNALEAGDNPIKVLREWWSLPAEALAQSLGLAACDIEALETGRTIWTDDQVKAFATALGVPLAVMTGEWAD